MMKSCALKSLRGCRRALHALAHPTFALSRPLGGPRGAGVLLVIRSQQPEDRVSANGKADSKFGATSI